MRIIKQSHIVGVSVNDKNGSTAMVSRTPISGVIAISVIITIVKIAMMIYKGWMNKVAIPKINPNKSIKFPLPRDVLFLLSNVSSENPNACLKIPLPKTLFLTVVERFRRENINGIDDMATIIPVQRCEDGAGSSQGIKCFT